MAEVAREDGVNRKTGAAYFDLLVDLRIAAKAPVPHQASQAPHERASQAKWHFIDGRGPARQDRSTKAGA